MIGFVIHVIHLGRSTCDLPSSFCQDKVGFCKSRGVDIFKSSVPFHFENKVTNMCLLDTSIMHLLR